MLLFADLASIEDCMLTEKCLRDLTGEFDPEPDAQANRASHKPPTKSSTTLSSMPTTSYPPPCQTFKMIYKFLDEHHDICISCFGTDANRAIKGCPPCAQKGWVCRRDLDAAAKIWTAYENRPKDRRSSRPGCDGHGRPQG
jgi:hypothetical protein